MGKVYAYSEIEGRRIPKKSDFSNAKNEVLDRLFPYVLSGKLYGAKVFGSVAYGTPSPRSDFDLVVVTEEQSELDTLKRIFIDIYNKTNVGIEPIVISRYFATKGFHSIDAYFLNHHLRAISSEGNIVGSDPSFLIEPQPISMVISQRQYLAQKVRRFREGMFTFNQEDRLRTLQRALEAPVNVGRRTLQVLYGELGYATEIVDDRKPSVIKAFRNVFKSNNLVDEFNTLIEKDRYYTFLLQEAVSGNISRQEYENTVLNLTNECIPLAFQWTTNLSKLYLHLTEYNKDIEVESSHDRKE